MTQRFRQMMRERAASTLDRWLMDYQTSGMPALVNFASGLQREGRAKLDLLRQRMLHAARCTSA